VKRQAFVLQLGPETRPDEGLFDGWIEELDTGLELRFRSTEALLTFLAQRFELAQHRQPPQDNKDDPRA
jgi:hypothetical protein